jgi:hypothetical protein
MWVGVGLFFGEKMRDILSRATFYLAGSKRIKNTTMGYAVLANGVLGLLANLKETREVRVCQVEAKYYEFYLRSNGCDTRNGN